MRERDQKLPVLLQYGPNYFFRTCEGLTPKRSL